MSSSVASETAQPGTGRRGGNVDRARQTVEEGLNEFNNHIHEVSQRLRPSTPELLRQAAVKAAVWAPVALGVGWGLITIAGRKFIAK